ncbi:methyltransferase domain-containing protein [Streptomyces sp. NBC_01614]
MADAAEQPYTAIMQEKKFSKTMLGDNVALYMSVQEVAALHIAKRLARYQSCVELCTAVGALAIQVARFIPRVTGVDIDPRRLECAKRNAETYGVEDRIEFIAGDVLDEELLNSITADIAILDPDWSTEVVEKSAHAIDIDKMQPSLRQMVLLTRKRVTSNIVMRIPRYFDIETLGEFGPHELESIFIDGRLRFKVAYFLPEIQSARETSIYLNGLGWIFH